MKINNAHLVHSAWNCSTWKDHLDNNFPLKMQNMQILPTAKALHHQLLLKTVRLNKVIHLFKVQEYLHLQLNERICLQNQVHVPFWIHIEYVKFPFSVSKSISSLSTIKDKSQHKCIFLLQMLTEMTKIQIWKLERICRKSSAIPSDFCEFKKLST